MPVGLVPAPVIVQLLPTSDPASVYLKTLSVVVVSSTTQRFVPSVTMSLGLMFLLLPLLFRSKLLAAFWLPDRRPAALVYRYTLSCEASTIQTSVPLVAMPSTVALE